MKWKISWLKTMPNEEYDVSEKITFDPMMFKKVSNIDHVSDIDVTGKIALVNDLVKVDLHFKGMLYLPCANTNEIGEKEFDFKINEILDDEEYISYEKDYIDLLQLVWQNLIMEAPTRYVKNECTNKSGKDWQMLSDEEVALMKEEKTESPFAKLEGLFNDDKED